MAEARQADERPETVRELPVLGASAAAQMAVDDGLLDEARLVCARRYVWSPPAVSVGKNQKLGAGAADELAKAGLHLVRRPSGGRAVLHGEGFEWSFAVVFPRGLLPYGTAAAYRLVSGAFATALAEVGVTTDAGRKGRYERSALCFATALRYDLLAGGEKAVAVAQAQRRGRVLVHGSVLERRPPRDLTAAVEAALGEPWRGEGLAAAGSRVESEALWRAFLARLSASLSGDETHATQQTRETAGTAETTGTAA